MAWGLTRGPRPSFDMGLDGAVNGANYMLGDSVSLINFIKVHVFLELRLLVGSLLLLIVWCLFNKMAASMHSSLSSSSSLIAILYSNCSADRSPNAK